jgi:diguanylate cyclase
VGQVRAIRAAAGWILVFSVVAAAMATMAVGSSFAAMALTWVTAVVGVAVFVVAAARPSATRPARVSLALAAIAEVLMAGGRTAFWYGDLVASTVGQIALPIGELLLAALSMVWITGDPALRSLRPLLTFWGVLLALHVAVILAAAVTTHNPHAPAAVISRLVFDLCILVPIVAGSRRSGFSGLAVEMIVYAFGLFVAGSCVLFIAVFSGDPWPALLPGTTAVGLALFPASYLQARYHSETRAVNVAVNSAPQRPLGLAIVCIVIVGLPIGRPSVVGSGDRVHIGVLLVLLVVGTSYLYAGIQSVRRSAASAAEADRIDGPTGLQNRIGLLNDAETGARSHCRSVLMIQIGGLELVSATYGRDIQTAVVADVAERIRCVVAPDEPVYRVDRQYFVVLSAGSADRLAELSTRLGEALAEPFRESGVTVPIDPAIGVATGSINVASIDGLLRDAGFAVVRAARAGTLMAVFDARARTRAAEQMRIVGDLRSSVTDGTLDMAYQPIIDLSTGRPAALEALLRWRHQGALRDPAYFLETVERTGTIIDIGYWVLDAALAQLAQVHATLGNTELAVSVNVSGMQLQIPGFERRVLAALAAHGISPSALWLELTETALISDVGRARGTLRPLADEGVRITLDDFGIGYSALSNLSNFPISIIKIDKSFTKYLATSDAESQKQGVIVAAIIDMASRLGIEVVVEGIETPELDLAARATCARYAQGWLYGRPEPAKTPFG